MAKKVIRRTQVSGGSSSRSGGGGAATATRGRAVRPQSRRGGLKPTWLIVGAVAVFVVGGLLWWLLNRPAASSTAGAERSVPNEGAAHVDVGTPIVYRTNPPASGTHYPATASYGVHEEVVEEGYWVHNLEHGAVVVLYKCPDGTCPERVEQLQDLYNSAPRSKWDNVKLVITPYDKEMETDFMAIAWNFHLPLETFDKTALLDFYRRHVDRGPEDVP